MKDHVIKAALWLLGQLGIQADVTSDGVAAAPLPSHGLHEQPVHFHPQGLFPLLDQGSGGGTELLAIPSSQEALAFHAGCGGADEELEVVRMQFDFWRGIDFLNVKQHPWPQMVRLSRSITCRGVSRS